MLTPERVRIVHYLREHGPVESLQELADALGRDKAAVSRDISSLRFHTLVEEERHGRKKRLRAGEGFVILY